MLDTDLPAPGNGSKSRPAPLLVSVLDRPGPARRGFQTVRRLLRLVYARGGAGLGWSGSPWATGLLVVGSVLVLLLALRLRLPNLGGRPLGFDEAFHSGAVLASPDIGSLRQAVTPQFQPLLDHLLRRFFWAPLLGSQELGIRLPAMIASLLAILATIITVAWGFLRNGRSHLEAAIAALAVGVWHAGYGQDIGASGFARHYALTGCVSIIWTGLFLFGQPERRWKGFALASLLFTNTHFFSLAMIGTGYALLSVEHLTRSKRRAALREVVVFVAIVLLTAAINWPALSALLRNPIEPRSIAEAGAVLTALGETRVLVERFLNFLDLPVMPAVLWLLLVLAGGLTRALSRSQVARVGSLACVAVPGLFFLGCLRSGYHLEDRYFMPFLGLAPVLLALGAVVLARLVEKAIGRLRHDSEARLAGAAALPLAAYLLVAAIRLALSPGSLRAPELPSRRAGLIEAIKREPQPVFLLSSPCWTDAVVRLYWRSMGVRAPADRLQSASQLGYQACVIGGFPPGSEAERELRDFLGRAPDGIIALYQHHLPCFPPRFEPPARLTTDGTGSSCLTILRGATSVEKARAAAVSVGYPATILPLLKQRQSQFENVRLY